MLADVLAYVSARGGAPLTEIRHAFDLPGEMAANLCIQLQDAGFLADQVLDPCHHLEGGSTGCSGCSGGSCSTSNDSVPAAVHGLEGFKQGCCGMNAPYQLTAAGDAYLRASGREPVAAARPVSEEDVVARLKHKAQIYRRNR